VDPVRGLVFGFRVWVTDMTIPLPCLEKGAQRVWPNCGPELCDSVVETLCGGTVCVGFSDAALRQLAMALSKRQGLYIEDKA
jgi:hypothetical protein